MGKFDDLPEARRKGLEKMEEVYGFEMTDGQGDFFRYTCLLYTSPSPRDS